MVALMLQSCLLGCYACTYLLLAPTPAPRTAPHRTRHAQQPSGVVATTPPVPVPCMCF